MSPLADLADYVEYLMDAMHLTAKTRQPNTLALFVASVATSLAVDLFGRDGTLEKLDDAMADIWAQAQMIFVACLSPTGHS